jgi:hypothetical protein
MSIFETHVKDVAERTDADPLELVSRFTTVTSEDTDDSGNATVEASPGEVVVVEGEGIQDGGTITVNLDEQAPPSGKIVVNHTGSGTQTASVQVDGDDTTVTSSDGTEGSELGSGENATYLADGDTYYEL